MRARRGPSPSPMRRGILAPLALLALVASTALAQAPVVEPQLSVFVEDPGRAFTPGAAESVTIVVNYNPTQTGRPAPQPTAERPENTAPTRVTLAVKSQPTWVSAVAFEPPELLIAMGIENTSTSFVQRATARLTVAPDAPALQREDFIVTATAEPNGNIQGASADSPELKVRALVVGKLNVTSEPMLVLPGGRWVDVPFTVRNDGNSDIVAKVNVTVRPENSQVEFRDTLELELGETKIVDVRVRTPWTNAELGTLELEATPIVDGEEVNPARFEVAVRGTSAVPGAPLPSVLVALLLLSRLRR